MNIEKIKNNEISIDEMTDFISKTFEKNDVNDEYEKYAKLYEERFNKKAYIPEPNGTREFAIKCIKKCLYENQDILDKLYYPTSEQDAENGILYWIEILK